MQAHTLGEVGILGTVLLRVYSGRIGILQIFFTEIGSYSTDMEQKVSWHNFFLTYGVFAVLFVFLFDFSVYQFTVSVFGHFSLIENTALNQVIQDPRDAIMRAHNPHNWTN